MRQPATGEGPTMARFISRFAGTHFFCSTTSQGRKAKAHSTSPRLRLSTHDDCKASPHQLQSIRQYAFVTEAAFLVAAEWTRRVELVVGVRPHTAVHFFPRLPRFSSQRANDGRS